MCLHPRHVCSLRSSPGGQFLLLLSKADSPRAQDPTLWQPCPCRIPLSCVHNLSNATVSIYMCYSSILLKQEQTNPNSLTSLKEPHSSSSLHGQASLKSHSQAQFLTSWYPFTPQASATLLPLLLEFLPTSVLLVPGDPIVLIWAGPSPPSDAVPSLRFSPLLHPLTTVLISFPPLYASLLRVPACRWGRHLGM